MVYLHSGPRYERKMPDPLVCRLQTADTDIPLMVDSGALNILADLIVSPVLWHAISLANPEMPRITPRQQSGTASGRPVWINEGFELPCVHRRTGTALRLVVAQAPLVDFGNWTGLLTRTGIETLREAGLTPDFLLNEFANQVKMMSLLPPRPDVRDPLAPLQTPPESCSWSPEVYAYALDSEKYILERWKDTFRDTLPYTDGPPVRASDEGVPIIEEAADEWAE